ncbi:hypothetical protein EXM36_07470 [Clostridium botulinum]|uniref:Exported protein n=3 Tax=Clostridium botulinum TaxID=1491 RepID=A5I645_CLOBH|nr:hypothetical protein [Clostridium botulinum]EPS48203.1 hypothetical protein CFSAN002369_17829 [Clostridium botulinum CFSAN002369]EPS48514.1 hypothetical protein CFSAN002367_19760 [Clostridium botulinum CFSAN002367]ABS34874.1 conserved hypothetical protein [Clostridium botulinum A str. ATCC 19397]ABS38930.1 conserved hypothetical protein [Clostridium botulinum A str. Hall]ACO87081.1 conserved hypothetical protein [Clostridium botulinum A2 str. Kyoto]
MEIIKKKRRFKLNWNKYKTVILLSFLITISGFFIVSNTMPKFVKDRSKVAIYFTKKPLDIRFRTESYTFYINEKILNDIGDKTYKTFNNMKNSTSNFLNNINRSHSLNKIGNVFYKVKEEVLGVFNGRGVK